MSSLARIVVSLAAGVLLLASSAPPAHAGGKALRCAFAKQRAVVRKIESVLECQREALRIGASVDPACTAAATAKLVESFTRAEMRGGCVPEGDVAGFQVVADQCSTRIGVPLQGTCTEAGEECGGGAAPCCTGLLCVGSVRGGAPVCSF